MRLDRVYVDGFKNLNKVTIDFDERKLTTVIIGQNGTGKSNLIEAITSIFRSVDLKRNESKFQYQVDYRIDGAKVSLSNLSGKATIRVNDSEITRAEFDRRKQELFPDLVFGYYSGGSRRLESLFDSHQRRYYDAIKLNDDETACAQALIERRLFYCRPIHGVMALISFFAFPDGQVRDELQAKLGLSGFHSLLTLFREPWFAKGGSIKKIEDADNFWGAEGPAGRTAHGLKTVAFHPMSLVGNSIDDYRDKQQSEAQYATFLPVLDCLQKFAQAFKDDREMFYALESMDISDLIREVSLWVTRINDASGDVSFADLSDGERQLLMALGLIRVSRGKRALFLLDEPDTHLNPHWQHSYLKLIQDWTGIAADVDDCHIIITSHNPLTIAALSRDEVRVMFNDVSGNVTVSPPYTDPRGMGFTATLTEIFGLPTSLDPETQRVVDERNTLAHKVKRSQKEERRLIEINDKLNHLGFMFEDREPLYQEFLTAWKDVQYADRPPLSPSQIEARRKAMSVLIEELIAEKGGAA